MTDRGDGESPGLVANRPRLSVERRVESVQTVNAVGADVGDVEAALAAARDQVGAVTQSRHGAQPAHRRALGRRRRRG